MENKTTENKTTDMLGILQRIKRGLRKSKLNHEIWLYGSFARGQQTPDSDLDLLVLVETEVLNPKEKQQIAFDLYEIEFETGQIISPLIMTKNQWTQKHSKTPFYENVTREAIRL